MTLFVMEYVYHELNSKYNDAKNREKYCMVLQEI